MANFFDTITEGVSVPLTTLASGYKPSGLIGEEVFPVVKSVTKGGKIPVFGKDAFRVYETLRARGAHSNRAGMSPDSWITFFCEEHDLAIPLDQRELNELNNLPGDAALKALFNLQDRQRRRVQWNLKLELEKVVADQVQSSASYNSSNVLALTNSDCWSETGSDPVGAIEDAREVIRGKIGVYPNTLIMGADTYACLKFHAAYTDKMKLTNDKVVRPDLIAQMHDLKRVIIGLSMGLNTSEAFYDLWSDNAILCYIPDTKTPDIDEPAFGYTIKPGFSATPYPYVDIFTEEGGKIVNVRCTDMYDTLIVNKDAGYLISNCKK
jgi:hypothetical protein